MFQPMKLSVNFLGCSCLVKYWWKLLVSFLGKWSFSVSVSIPTFFWVVVGFANRFYWFSWMFSMQMKTMVWEPNLLRIPFETICLNKLTYVHNILIFSSLSISRHWWRSWMKWKRSMQSSQLQLRTWHLSIARRMRYIQFHSSSCCVIAFIISSDESLISC